MWNRLGREWHETWAEDVTLCLRERLAIITFIAISVQTASRPYLNISICTLRGDLRKTGALHGEFDIWIRRSAVAGQPNELLGFFVPRWGKTKRNWNQPLPLPPGPTWASSSIIMVLICLCVAGGLEWSAF